MSDCVYATHAAHLTLYVTTSPKVCTIEVYYFAHLPINLTRRPIHVVLNADDECEPRFSRCCACAVKKNQK